MSEKRSFENVVAQTAILMKKLKIEYAFVGGVAVSAWGNVRTTVDVDVVMRLEAADVSRLVSVFREQGFSVSKEDVDIALKERQHFTIFDDRSSFHLDVKGVYGEREEETLRSRKRIMLADIEYFFSSPEDTIANKLFFGSDQDLRDAEGIYIRQAEKLDHARLTKLSERLGVAKQLSSLRKRVQRYMKEARSKERRK